MFKDLVVNNRSYRRFYEEQPITKEALTILVDYARLAASGANKQPLKYFISFEKELNEKIFPHLAWAGYLAQWPGPEVGERPTGYIIVLQDKENKMVGGIDHGIAAQNILLGAVEMGLGGCIIYSVKREQLQAALSISKEHEILIVIALGHPKEVVVIEEIEKDGDIKYWRDENQIHHVPKRKLEDILLNK